MPEPPDLDQFDKVNYVIDAWILPCDAPWYVYIRTLKPAALAALITLLTFGWDDVLRGFARPPGLGGRRRTGKKRGKGGKIGVRGFPEIGEMLGRQVPGSESVKGIKWSDGLKTLWRIDTIVQAHLFALLIADITVDFAFNWTSLLYETRWCQDSARGRFSSQKGPPELVSPGFWNEIVYTISDYEYPPPSWIIAVGFTGIKGATISFSLDWRPQNPAFPPTSFSSRLVDKITGEVFGEAGPTIPDSDGKATHIISAPLPAGRSFGVQGFAAGFWGIAQDGAIVGLEDML